MIRVPASDRRCAAGLALVVITIFPGASRSQDHPFLGIGRAEGLTSMFVHAIAQDAKGYLWIGTGEGAARFDGHEARMFTTADGLAENTVSALLATPDDEVWVGHDQGGLSRWNGRTFTAVDLHDLTTSTITAVVEDGAGGAWFTALNDGLLHVDADGSVQRTSDRSAAALWYALLRSPDGALLAGRSDGCHLITTSGSSIKVHPLPEVTTAPVLSLAAIGPRFFAGTDGEGVTAFTLSSTQATGIRALEAGELPFAQIKDMAADADGHLIVATFGQGAYEIVFDQEDDILNATRYHGTNGLGTDNVSAAFVDRENVLWLSRFSQGVARRTDRAVTLYAANKDQPVEIRSIAFDGSHTMLGINGGILIVTHATGAITDTLGAADGLPADAVTAMIVHQGSFWVGTERSGLYLRIGEGAFEQIPLGQDHLSRHVNGLALRGDELWVATSNGIYALKEGSAEHYTTVTGLPHNQVNAVFSDRGGQVWIGCNNGGIAWYDSDGLHRLVLDGLTASSHISAIAQDGSGGIWFATLGSGIWRGIPGEPVSLKAADGLGSDHIQALAIDARDRVWAAHRGGISRFDPRSNEVLLLGDRIGLDPDRKAFRLAFSDDGALLLGTDNGALRYNAAMHREPVAPQVVDLLSVRANDHEIPFGTTITLDPDAYRMDFSFMGVSLKDPGAITYRYMLEGHDLAWSTTSAAVANYRRLEDGSYTFRVKACNGPACSPLEASISITVLAPIWKRSWFVALIAIAVLACAHAVVRARSRSQKRIREYLERTLEERTGEVKAHTEELARKNKDITDSITYARRIQQATLPGEDQLRLHFPRSFIFHQPRDIVSGDFYWFRRFEDKFLLACVDCTGHGVPGAFMSMIGTLLLRDISSHKNVNSPDQVLQRLDSELRNVLHYNGREDRSNDGMDISVCEIDLGTRELRAACAMHDLLIFRKGELLRVKGERSSIGGIQRNGHPNTFGRIEHDLQKGDRLYLFSDGIPDQFGGLHGRKLKVSGVMDLVDSFCRLPMDEQAVVFRNKFMSWMNGHEQLDDVLFIGIEV